MSMQTTIHPEIEMGEVKLKVSNLDRSISFYEDVLGFQATRQEEGRAELAVPNGKVLVSFEELKDAVARPQRTSGLYHFAILLPSRADLGLMLSRLIDAGIDIGQADHAVSEALYIADPDGNGIEIYRDRPRSEWKYEANGNIHMVTDPIDWHGLLREAEGRKWQGLPNGTKMGHVHLHVHDLAAAKQFYCDVLGFDVMLDGARFMGALFIAAGGYHHHLGLNIWAGRGVPALPNGSPGLKYYTLEFPNEPALQEVLGRLRDAGYAPREEGTEWFVEDPSDITIRLTLQSH